MNHIVEEIGKIGIVPVIALEDAADADNLARALEEGGLPCAEVTFRTKAAKEAIRIMADSHPDLLVGAGTVLTVQQAQEAHKAGAKFIVSPGLNPKVVRWCTENGIPVIPGCCCPSDIEAAMELGLDTVKFFPAEAAGGLPMIKAMSAPYGNIKFMPTGGINAKNLNTYLAFSKIIACGGSWMVAKDLLAARDWGKVTQLCQEAVQTMLGFSLDHVGINEENEGQALQTAFLFAKVFGFGLREEEKFVFAGTAVEVMKTPGYGKYGHIAIGTNSVERAVWHLKRAGIAFREESAVRKEKGTLKSIYLQEEFGGFAVHLMKK